MGQAGPFAYFLFFWKNNSFFSYFLIILEGWPAKMGWLVGPPALF